MNFLNPWTSRSRCYQNGSPLEINKACLYNPGMRFHSRFDMLEDGGGQLEHGTWPAVGVESIHHADEETQIYKTKRQDLGMFTSKCGLLSSTNCKNASFDPPPKPPHFLYRREALPSGFAVSTVNPTMVGPLPIKIDLEPLLFFVQNPGGPFFRLCCCFILHLFHLDPKMNWMQPATATEGFFLGMVTWPSAIPGWGWSPLGAPMPAACHPLPWSNIFFCMARRQQEQEEENARLRSHLCHCNCSIYHYWYGWIRHDAGRLSTRASKWTSCK